MLFHLQLNRKYCFVMFKVIKLEYLVVSVDVSDSLRDIIILSCSIYGYKNLFLDKMVNKKL